MRVALLSCNARAHNAVGNHIAEKVRFFLDRGADVRVFVEDARHLHPVLRSCTREQKSATLDGPTWEYLRHADLIFAVYAQACDLLQYLPRLAGTGPRIVFDYLGVTPLQFWRGPHRQGIERTQRERGHVWCADHALTISAANKRELLEATDFPAEHATTQQLAVDLAQYPSHQRDRFLQKKLGINGRIALYVGRLAPNKRVPLLIEALARMDDRSLHAVLVGDCRDVYAEEASRCLALARQLGVQDRVHLMGELVDADLARAYCSADVLAIPSVHEGFCVPVIEAMAAGCPVVAARAAALPETIADAGLTFTPDDADDLARQLRRVLNEPSSTPTRAAGRIAVVSFRFGDEIVGGAETSLRTMASALQNAHYAVEIFTTCTRSESRWQNELPAGASSDGGFTVHRFPVDAHDHATHGQVVRAINDARGIVPDTVAARYLQQSIHSNPLLQALRERRHEFDAIIAGPYLFGLTADVASEFPGKTLVVPCFHDEAIARLKVWPRLYGEAAGLLFHSTEEQEFAQVELGVNHPNTAVIGTYVPPTDNVNSIALPGALTKPYVVYCGRYSAQKNVPLLLEWFRKYRDDEREPLDLVFMGQGDIRLPKDTWLHDLGRVDDATKRGVLARARALAQLSCQESLSLVVLEAWAEGTPVIVHRDCAVLAGQIERSQGGVAVSNQDQFAAALTELIRDQRTWAQRGDNGRAYVARHYSASTEYASRLERCVQNIRRPIGDLMRERGRERARHFARERWQQRFSDFVERILSQPARTRREDVRVEPLRSSVRANGAHTLLLPVRFCNHGTHAAVPEGPGRTVVCCEIRSAVADTVVIPCVESNVPGLVLPGQSLTTALLIETPAEEGVYRICLWTEASPRTGPSPVAEVILTMDAGSGPDGESCVSSFLDSVARTLPAAHRLQQLPEDYVDVTEGALAPIKRFIKRKMLHNFKDAYVDVLSRQQSQVNAHLVLMIQQLAECCAVLDQAVTGLYQNAAAADPAMEAATRRPHG